MKAQVKTVSAAKKVFSTKLDTVVAKSEKQCVHFIWSYRYPRVHGCNASYLDVGKSAKALIKFARHICLDVFVAYVGCSLHTAFQQYPLYSINSYDFLWILSDKLEGAENLSSFKKVILLSYLKKCRIY